MPSIRKRGAGFRAEVYVKGVRDSATFDTKSEALQWALDRETEIRDGKTETLMHYTLGDAFEKYADEVSVNKRGARWEQIRLTKLSGYPLAKKRLADLCQRDFIQFRNTRLTEVAPSSVNREFNLLSNVLTYCRVEWHWITDNPLEGVKRPPKGEARDRLVEDWEKAEILLAAGFDEDLPVTTKSQRMAVAWLFALETAMRLKEVIGLNDQAIKNNVAYLYETKTTPRKVPLSKRALELLEKVKPDYFPGSSESYSALFRKIRLKTNVEDMTFHDSRHQAITDLAQKLDVLELARMVGHKDLRQLMTYYNKKAEDIAEKL